MAKLLRKENGKEIYSSDFEFKSVSIDDYSIEMIGSTPAIDRDGESISVEGWDLKNFKTNPVVLLNHNYHELPVAKAETVKVKDGKLVFKIVFPKDGVYGVADTVRRLYKDGFMNASSIGFKPSEWIDGNGDKKKPLRTYTKQELLEISLVTVPSNPEALVSAKGLYKSAIEKNIVTQEEIQAIEDFFKEETPNQEIETLKEEIKEIKKLIDVINDPANEQKLINAIIEKLENVKFEKGYNELIFNKDEPQAPKSELDINAIISAVQNTIKNNKAKDL
jgi:HK97 family phage prohead protease